MRVAALPPVKAVQVEHIRLTLALKAPGLNQLKVHPLSNLWFQIVNLQPPYTPDLFRTLMVGGAVQARPRGLKAPRFQNFNLMKEKLAFNLKPELYPGA